RPLQQLKNRNVELNDRRVREFPAAETRPTVERGTGTRDGNVGQAAGKRIAVIVLGGVPSDK
ncbi:MAG: hypothetical protein ACREX5_19920, partial [Achromobacter pestifer]